MANVLADNDPILVTRSVLLTPYEPEPMKFTWGWSVTPTVSDSATSGTVVLVAGAATVSTIAVTSTSRIVLTSQVDGGTPGFLRVTARVAGASFTIGSSSASDTSTVAWVLIGA